MLAEDTFQFNHKYSFTWHTGWLEPCKKCASLDGQVFTDQDLFQHALYSPIWGDLWDLDNDLPLTHPNCKCYLDVQYDATLDELLLQKMDKSGYEDFKIMTSNIKEMKTEIADFERDLSRAQSRIENTKYQLLTYLTLLQRAGLPPDIEKAIGIIVRARMTIEQTQRALYLLLAASGPAGWLMALASAGVAVYGFGSTVQATQDLVMDIGGT